MKVLHVGIFEDHALGGDIVLEGGLVANGCEVTRFDHRAVARAHGREGMNARLVEAARNRDLVFVGKGDALTRSTLAAARRGGAAVALWYGDIRPAPEPWLLDLLPEVDAFFMSSSGAVLRAHFEQGRPGRAAYYFNPSDPALVARYAHLPRGTRPVVFTGTPHAFAGPERQAVVTVLKARGDVTFFGGADRTAPGQRLADRVIRRVTGRQPGRVRGEAYVAAIRSGRVGVGVNAVNDVPRYTSDRLTHFLAFGTFFITRRFPGLEDLFVPGRELVAFDDPGELPALIDRYLADDAAREAIAAAGQARILGDYDHRTMVRMMLDVLATGTSDRYPWAEVYG